MAKPTRRQRKLATQKQKSKTSKAPQQSAGPSIPLESSQSPRPNVQQPASKSNAPQIADEIPMQKAQVGSQRGVVLGSSWRLVHGILAFDPAQPTAAPKIDRLIYYPQFYSIDALVRRSILYFDRLEWPVNNLMPQGELLHGKYLESQGVIHRREISFPGVTQSQVELIRGMSQYGIGTSVRPGDIPDQLTHAHIEIFRRLEAAEPGRWAFATIGEGMEEQTPDPRTPPYRAALIELYDCLPVPEGDVPYNEILEFKQKRGSELLELRASMDDMYRAIENDVDRPLARNAEIEKLEKSLINLRDSMSASRFKYRLEFCGIEFSLPEVHEIGIAVAASLATHSSIPLLVAAAACVKFSPKLRRSPINVPDGLKYIYHAQREGIVRDSA